MPLPLLLKGFLILLFPPGLLPGLFLHRFCSRSALTALLYRLAATRFAEGLPLKPLGGILLGIALSCLHHEKQNDYRCYKP